MAHKKETVERLCDVITGAAERVMRELKQRVEDAERERDEAVARAEKAEAEQTRLRARLARIALGVGFGEYATTYAERSLLPSGDYTSTRQKWTWIEQAEREDETMQAERDKLKGGA